MRAARAGGVAVAVAIAVIAVVFAGIGRGNQAGLVTVSADEDSPAFLKAAPSGGANGVRGDGTVTAPLLPLVNVSEHPVTLREVDLVGGEPGIELVGSLAAGEERETLMAMVAAPGWPPGSDPRLDGLRPPSGYGAIDGFVVEPEESDPRHAMGVLPILGLRLDPSVDRASFVALEILYEHEGVTYREAFPITLALCWEQRIEQSSDCAAEYGNY